MDKTLRIKADIGKDKVLHLNMKQNVDLFEILSLQLSQEDAYKIHSANYGVIVGRVLANDAFGIPNAKVSVFIPLTDEDSLNNDLVNLYPYKEVNDTNKNGKRYNILPNYSENKCYSKVGTFPSKRLVLDNDSMLEVYDKYYKYTTTTNKAGDYMIFGVPTGSTQIHVDIDLSDIGIISQKPRDLISKGYSINQFQSPTKFNESNTLDDLAQLYSQNETVMVYPFWGDENFEQIAISRKDVSIQYEFTTSCVFLGSVITDSRNNNISFDCDVSENMGEMSQLVPNEGTIEMIRKTPYGNVEELVIKGNQLIDSDGTWCYQIPMNLDYVGMDEKGNIVPTNDPTKGIPTRASVRFRFSLTENSDSTISRHKAKYLVPNNPKINDGGLRSPILVDDDYDNMYEFGTNTPDSCFRDLLWDCVYSVKNYIPRTQINNYLSQYYTGIKGVNKESSSSKNIFPYNKIRTKVNLSTNEILSNFWDDFFSEKAEVKQFQYVFWDSAVNRTQYPELDTYIESVLEEDDAISLDFYNDWINGCLYFPLWYWRNNATNSLNGNVSYIDTFCSSSKSYNNLILADTGNLPICFEGYGGLASDTMYVKNHLIYDNNKNALNDAPRTNGKYSFFYRIFNYFRNLYTTYFDDVVYRYDKIINYMKLNNGLIKNVLNKDGINIYYYNSSQYSEGTSNKIIRRLYSTDIILLGSLSDSDINGIPKFSNIYPMSSCNLPPMGTHSDDEGNNSVTGMHWGTSKDDENIDLDDEGYRMRKGLFFGTRRNWYTFYEYIWLLIGRKEYKSIITAYTSPKTFINLERICELGVSLDMPIADKNGDGLITVDEIQDNYSRQIFSTLNSNTLLVSDDSVNSITGYNFYKLKYLCPYDFNGLLKNYKEYYANDSDATIPEEENGFDEVDNDYLKFRFGETPKFYIKRPNDEYFFPLYNNSFYFYFGINEGSTAIDKFKRDYIDECLTDSDSTSNMNVQINYTASTYCNDNNGVVTINCTNCHKFEYTFGENVGVSSDDSNIVTISNLANGTYHTEVTGYDSNGYKVGSYANTIKVYPTPIKFELTSTNGTTESEDEVGSILINYIELYGSNQNIIDFNDRNNFATLSSNGGNETYKVKVIFSGNSDYDGRLFFDSNLGKIFFVFETKNIPAGIYSITLQEYCGESPTENKLTRSIQINDTDGQ